MLTAHARRARGVGEHLEQEEVLGPAGAHRDQRRDADGQQPDQHRARAVTPTQPYAGHHRAHGQRRADPAPQRLAAQQPAHRERQRRQGGVDGAASPAQQIRQRLRPRAGPPGPGRRRRHRPSDPGVASRWSGPGSAGRCRPPVLRPPPPPRLRHNLTGDWRRATGRIGRRPAATVCGCARRHGVGPRSGWSYWPSSRRPPSSPCGGWPCTPRSVSGWTLSRSPATGSGRTPSTVRSTGSSTRCRWSRCWPPPR